MSFLELAGLEKTFADGTPAVRGVDLAVGEGELVVLLGPSGCGKTTTLRMVAGLETPSAGRVLLRGEDVTRRRPSERDVGFVFQFYALYPHLSVRENVAFPLRCAGRPRREIEARVQEVAKRLGLEPLLARRPRELSGGDQQRVALARAMVRRPALFLMDEPLGTLDAARRLEMAEYLRARQLELGVTTLYVTHDQAEALFLADRVVVMDGGRIRQIGSPAEIYDEPASLFVATFVGSPGMNLVEGVLERSGGALCFRPRPRSESESGSTPESRSGSDLRSRPSTDSLPGSHLDLRSDSGAVSASVPIHRDLAPQDAVLGARPEALLLGAAGRYEGRVAAREYMGAYRDLYLDTALGRLVARASADHPARVGETLRFDFDPGRLRLFARATGERL